MAEYIIPDVPLECLQAILKELILTRDSDAVMVSPPEPALQEAESVSIGES